MDNTLEVACLSSITAVALAYLAYKVVEGQSTIPIEVGGEIVFMPKTVLDILSDLRKFGIPYNDAITRIHEGPCLPEDQYAVVLQADGKWEMYVPFWLFREMCSVDTVYSVQDEFTALYKRVITACAKNEEIEDDLLSYREQQKAKIQEVRVSRCRFDEDFR